MKYSKLVEKLDRKFSLKLVVCLFTVLVFSVYLNYVLVSNLERQIMSQPPSQPSFLDVKITPRDVKLHVNETQVFTATVTDGVAPYSYTWKRDMNVTLGYEQNLTFSFSVATPYAMLSVDVVDSRNRVGYDFVKVEDPYSSSDVYLNAFAMPYRYMIEADGLGWYRSINGSNGAIVSSGTDASPITSEVLDAMIASTSGPIRYLGTLHFTKGIFEFNTVVQKSCPVGVEVCFGPIIEGEGRYVTKLKAIGAHGVFWFNGTARTNRFEAISIRNVEISSDAGARVANAHALVFSWVTFVEIYDSYLYNSYDSAVFSNSQMEGIWIWGCGIYGNWGCGLEVGNDGEVHFFDNGIAYNGLDNIILSSCANAHISDNNIMYAGRYGIFFYSTRRSTISDNTICVNARDGIILNEDSNNNTISGNTIFENSNETDNSYSGIRIGGCSNNVVSANRIYDESGAPNQQWGIKEEGTSDYNIIIGCNTRQGGVTGGIKRAGANTHVNLCWNNTVWIP